MPRLTTCALTHSLHSLLLLRIATRKPEPGHGKVRVSQLVIYPLKSGKGIYVDRAELGPYGFKYDRQWYQS